MSYFEDDWEEDYEEDFDEFVEDGDFNCWNCLKPVTYEAHANNDGFCPHCMSEIDLEEESDD